MKKTGSKVLLTIILIIVLVMSFSVSTFAYSLCPYRHSSSKIYYYYDNYIGSRAISFIYNGANAWRAKTTEAQLLLCDYHQGTGFDVYIYTGSITDVDWDGLTQTKYSSTYPHYVTSQNMILNTAQTFTWNNDGALKSVVAHEMGHVFGLNDNGTAKTIMNCYTYGYYSRYAYYGLTLPQADDVNGVNAKY